MTVYFLTGIGSGLTVCVSFSASFVVLFTFPIVSEVAGYSAPFWMFTVVTIIGFVFIFYMVPETRGMTLAEIQDTLKSGKVRDTKVKTNGPDVAPESVTTYF